MYLICSFKINRTDDRSEICRDDRGIVAVQVSGLPTYHF